MEAKSQQKLHRVNKLIWLVQQMDCINVKCVDEKCTRLWWKWGKSQMKSMKSLDECEEMMSHEKASNNGLEKKGRDGGIKRDEVVGMKRNEDVRVNII